MRRFLLVFFLLLVTGFVFADDVNLLNGLVSYYNFDETSGSTLYDLHGANNGTNYGATINQTGIINKSYYLKNNTIQFSKPTLSSKYNYSINLWLNAALQNNAIWGIRAKQFIQEQQGEVEQYVG